MSGEFATSEWRVAVLSVVLVSSFVVSPVLLAPHVLLHLAYGKHRFPRATPPQMHIVRMSV